MLPLMLCLQRYDYLTNSPASGKKPERNAAKSKKALNRVEKGIKESLGQMQLEVDISRLGGSSAMAEGKTPEQVMEDNLRWAVVDVFGDRLNSFLTEVFTEMSIGSTALLKELESKAVRKSRRNKIPIS